MLPAVTQDPSPRWSIRVEAGSDEADLPAATTTSVPVAGCKRGAAHNATTARMATTAAAIHRIRGRELRRGPVDGYSAPRRLLFRRPPRADRHRMHQAPTRSLCVS